MPGGFCLDADAYRHQIARSASKRRARRVRAPTTLRGAQAAVEMRLGLYEQPIAPEILEPLLAAWRAQRDEAGALSAVRSSALVEDRDGSSFAGQFESFLGLESEADFLTAVRACWAALWSTRALRYMATHDLDPADTAMAVLIQPLVAARASGGGLSETAEGGMLVTATWGLGSAIAQGEVMPDRYRAHRGRASLRTIDAGRKDHRDGCGTRPSRRRRAVPKRSSRSRASTPAQAMSSGAMLRKAETFMGMPVEIEWALDEAGFKLLQARPLHVQPAHVPDEIWLQHPRLNGHPGRRRLGRRPRASS